MIRNYLVNLMQDALFGPNPYEQDKRKQIIKQADLYSEGTQPASLRVEYGRSDDNIIVNFTRLIIDRSVSLLFGEEVEFDLPGSGESVEDEWLDLVWKLNGKLELLNDLAEYGAASGTVYVQFIPDGIEKDGATYPQMLPIDSAWVTIKTEPENYKNITAYWVEFVTQVGDRKKNRKRVIRPEYKASDVTVETDGTPSNIVDHWIIEDYIEADNGVMVTMRPDTLWQQNFAPLLAWKNLPRKGSPYGRADITPDVMHLQDKINLVYSNANKVVRLQAHQRLWGKLLKGVKSVGIGPDQVINVQDKDGSLGVLDASGADSITVFGDLLREAMFTIARSTDPQAIKDKVGQLTNFGLRILYKDGLDKLKTKRGLYGDALKEINRRLLILGNQTNTDPGEVKWGEALPIDDRERVVGEQFELDAGLTSKQTIREERGRDNETELERLATESTQSNQNNDNLGGLILKNFNNSKNMTQMKGMNNANDNNSSPTA